MAGITMELGISANSIGEWVRKAEYSGDPVDEDECAERKYLCKRADVFPQCVRSGWLSLGLAFDPVASVLGLAEHDQNTEGEHE
jgi:hypothetical protein